MPKSNHDKDTPVEQLLGDLRGPASDHAWKTFLERYAPTLMRISNQYAATADEAHDCFLFVCERLCESDCRRLQQYSLRPGATFDTWLIAITGNLCIDWHRSMYGRSTMPAAIQRLPELEQSAYRVRFEQRLDLESCLFAMRRQFPQLERARLAEALATVHASLSPKQRWRFTALAQRQIVSLEGSCTGGDTLRDHGRGPEREAQMDQLSGALESALSHLPSKQRMVLRLRYEQDLTLDAIARIAGLRDLHHARRMIEAALKALQEQLSASGFSL